MVTMLQRLFGLCLAALVLASCQEPTQPSDLTGTRTLTIEMRRSTGEPIQDATIVWERFTGVNAPLSGVGRTGEDGFSRLVVSDVATRRDSIRISVDPPNVDPFIGIGPTEIFAAVCTDTLISITLSPLTQCGTVNLTDTIILEACPENGRAIAQTCRYYATDCPAGLIFMSADSMFNAISIVPSSAGAASSTLELCAIYSPMAGATEDQVFTTRVVGRDPSGGAERLGIDLTVIGKVNCTPCPCPEFSTVVDTTITVCVGLPTELEIELNSAGVVSDLGPDCVVELTLKSVQSDNQITVLSDDELTLRAGQSLPPLTLEVTGVQAGELRSEIRYSVRTRRLSDGNIENCPNDVVVDVTIPVADANCRIEPTMIDSLEKCVFNEFSTADTIFLVNDGDCEAVYEVSVTGRFSTSQSGGVTVPARSRTAVVVTLAASKSDWDANPDSPRGTKGYKTFLGTLSIRGCATINLDLVGEGYVQCSAFKFQCLREYRPATFPDVYAESIELVEDRTNIVYQNDNQTFRRYDLWIESVTDLGGGAYEVSLGSGDPDNNYNAGRFVRIATNFFVNPGDNICDVYPADAALECANTKDTPGSGSETISGVRSGDVILFVKGNRECALLWVQKIDLDRAGGSALPAACLEICYPMFTLP